MRVNTRELVPYDAQILGALGDLDAHEALNGLGVAHRVTERADAADALSDEDELSL